MTAPALRLHKLTEQEYLELLQQSQERYEYVEGFVYAHAGASNAHNRISLNLAMSFQPEARCRGCQTYQSDMRLQLVRAESGAFTYYFPDLMVSYEPAIHDVQALYLTAPCLIVEILSPSTRSEERSYKAERYQALPSLQAYLLVESQSRGVAQYRRTEAGWVYEVLGEWFTVPCLELELTLDEIYAGIPL